MHLIKTDAPPPQVHTCPHCKERAHDHGTSDAASTCWYCNYNTDAKGPLHWTNGLDLDLSYADDQQTDDSNRTSYVSWEARVEWNDLCREFGELTPVEEALISRVSACTTVLRLPSERQYGYRGNTICFIMNLSRVSQQLPLAPADCDIIVYRVKGKEGRSKLERVRREAVRRYLLFFSKHHHVYKWGIRNPRGLNGAPDEYLVPPFDFEKDLNEDALAALPVDGVPEGLKEKWVEGDDDDDGDDDGERDQHAGDGEGTTGTVRNSQRVNTQLLSLWLQHGVGALVEDVRPQLAPTMEELRESHTLDSALARLHNLPQSVPRPDFITVANLAARLVDMRPGSHLLSQTKRQSEELKARDLLHNELLAVVKAQGISFSETGMPHSFCGEAMPSGQVPIHEHAASTCLSITHTPCP